MNGRHEAMASPKYRDTREVLVADEWPTRETSAKSMNQLSPPMNGRREQLLATKEVLVADEWPTRETSAKSMNQLSPPMNGRPSFYSSSRA
ncbi:19111_t:CDS:2 [Funneliformis geosporum]|uniref:19111_t:CDS:1 n=1 Tax=Funneliformis geosporum TaxID=1117311 RepID=A0A9W4WYD5_9GLOM|nr:19111_t:CDS:2 [Funneliformis geosporum]